ncbi:MAG: M23 family metallopeptidase [Acidobacteriota bacterium]
MKFLRPHVLALAVTASLLTLPVLAQPNVTILDLQPSLANAAQAFPLAAQTSLDDETYEISFNVTLRNDEPTRVELAGVDLVFGAGFTPFANSLAPQALMRCGSGALQTLTTSGRINPGETCRLMLTDDTRIEPWVPEWITMNMFFTDYSPLVTLIPAVAYYNDQPRGGFLFPASTNDLAPGEFWSGRSKAEADAHRRTSDQMFAYDMGVGRWDPDAGEWTPFHPLAPGEPENGDENEDWLVWGKPIYAMADGVVQACTDGVADNVPRQSGTGSGNGFGIMHGSERASYVHFINGSTNPALCFVGAVVKAGDFLGLAGNSGSSTAPHLHVHIRRGGQGFPILFRDTFIVDRNTHPDPPLGNADWQYVDGKGLPWEELIVWPSPLLRRDSLATGDGWNIDVLDLDSDTIAVAQSLDQGGLTLRTVGRDGNGDLWFGDKMPIPSAKRAALAKTSVTNDFVTAVQNDNDELQMTVWDGFLGLRSSAVAGDSILDVAVTSSPHLPGVVTAARTESGDLRVTGWEVDGWGVIQEGDSDSHGPISSVAVATAPTFGGVVTAVRTGGGLLRLSSWLVSNDESSVGVLGDYDDLPVWDLDIAYLGVVNGKDRFLTAAENAAGNLYLVTWEVQANGVINRLDDYVGGPVEDVAVSDGGDSHALTAVVRGSGHFKLIGWNIANDGSIEVHGEATAEEVTWVALGNAMFVNPTNRRQAVSVARQSDGEIRISSWEVALEP